MIRYWSAFRVDTVHVECSISIKFESLQKVKRDTSLTLLVRKYKSHEKTVLTVEFTTFGSSVGL